MQHHSFNSTAYLKKGELRRTKDEEIAFEGSVMEKEGQREVWK